MRSEGIGCARHSNMDRSVLANLCSLLTSLDAVQQQAAGAPSPGFPQQQAPSFGAPAAAPAFGMFTNAASPPQPAAQQPAGFGFSQGPSGPATATQALAGGFGGFAQPSQPSQPTSLFSFGASQPQQAQQQPGPFGAPAQPAALPQGGFAAFSQPPAAAPPPFGSPQQPQQQATFGAPQQAQQQLPPAPPTLLGGGFAPPEAAQPSQPAFVGFGGPPLATTAPAGFGGAPAPPAQPSSSLFTLVRQQASHSRQRKQLPLPLAPSLTPQPQQRQPLAPPLALAVGTSSSSSSSSRQREQPGQLLVQRHPSLTLAPRPSARSNSSSMGGLRREMAHQPVQGRWVAGWRWGW